MRSIRWRIGLDIGKSPKSEALRFRVVLAGVSDGLSWDGRGGGAVKLTTGSKDCREVGGSVREADLLRLGRDLFSGSMKLSSSGENQKPL